MIPLLAEAWNRGLSGIPYAWTIVKAIPFVALLYLFKLYFNGATCRAERLMHGKVVMITVNPINSTTKPVANICRVERLVLEQP